MVNEDGFLNIGFVPSFDELEQMMEEEELEKEVELTADDQEALGLDATGTDSPGQTAEGGGGGGGAGMAGLLEPVMGMSKKLATLVGIAGVLLMLEPIQQTLSLIMRMLEIAVLPVMILLVNILRPFVQAMLRLIPSLLSFVSNPGKALKKVFETVIGRLKSIFDNILNFPSASEIGDTIGERIKSFLPDWMIGGGDDDSDTGGGGDSPDSPFSQSPALNFVFNGENVNLQEVISEETKSEGSGQGQQTGDQQTQDQIGVLDDVARLTSNFLADLTDEAKKESAVQNTSNEVDKNYGANNQG